MSYPPLPKLEPLIRHAVSPTRVARRLSIPRSGLSATKKRRAEVRRRVLSLVEQLYCRSDLRLEYLARETGIPKRTIQHAFNEAETSFQDELHAVRMRNAAELVIATKKPAEIAPKVGYQHANHFADAFERTHGVRPTALRKALIARDRYEGARLQSPPESPRALRARDRQMGEDQALVHLVRAQLIEACALPLA